MLKLLVSAGLSPCGLYQSGITPLFSGHFTESAKKAVSEILKEEGAPKEDCALEIIKAGALRQEELYYDRSVWPSLLLRNPGRSIMEFLFLRRFNMDKFINN